MIPEFNNVYGLITAPNGLMPVQRALEGHLVEIDISLTRSGFDGSERLRLESENVDFESDPLENRTDHLFSGAVGGTEDDVVAFVQDLSAALNNAGIRHVFEVYRGKQVICRLPEETPTNAREEC